jgi:hypothetical protein
MALHVGLEKEEEEEKKLDRIVWRERESGRSGVFLHLIPCVGFLYL